MQKYKQLLITTVIVPALICTTFSVAVADITGGHTIINTVIKGYNVSGKSNSNGGTILTDASAVPQYGDTRRVYDNHCTIENGGEVTADVYAALLMVMAGI